MKRQIILMGFLVSVLVTSGGGFVSLAWGNTLVITDIVKIEVTGADMVGMEVTAMFDGGFSETLTWGLSGAQDTNGNDIGGFVVGTDWFLSQAGDTYAGESTNGAVTDFNWRLVNNRSEALTKLVIDGVLDNGSDQGVVFDIRSKEKVTEPSGFGTPFTMASTDEGSAQASYSQPVVGAGSLVVGDDLFGGLEITFGSATPVQMAALTQEMSQGLLPGGSINFAIDTDIVTLLLENTGGDDTTGGDDGGSGGGNNPIPEPETFFLLASGLLGLLSIRWIRSKRVAIQT